MKPRSRAVAGFLAVAMLAGLVASAEAKTELDVDAQVRLRYEGSDRSFQPSTGYDHVILQRVRASLALRSDQGLEGLVQLQDSRRWGEEGETTVDLSRIDLHQGYLKVNDLLDAPVDFIAGRKELSYGQERLIGALDWSNVGRSFDTGQLRIRHGDAWVDVAGAKVAETATAGARENVGYVIGHWSTSSDVVLLEPLVIYKEREPGAIYVTSLGTYGKIESGRIRSLLDLAYQTGKRGGADVGAYLVSADVAVDLSKGAKGKWGVLGGVSLYTGNDPTSADDNAFDNAFDNLYPTGRKFHGYLDLAAPLAGDRGLLDVHGKVWVRGWRDSKLLVAYHFFRTEVDADPSQDLGNEIDVVIQQKVRPGFQLELGGGAFLPGDLAKAEVGDETAVLVYLMGTADF